jgi:SAM-dependent methyltransferase
MLERAMAKHAGKPFRPRLGDVELLLSEDDNAYDAVVARHLVWTLTDPLAAFARWLQVLKPGGRLLIIDGDWVTTPLHGRFLRALGNRISLKDTIHGDNVDMAWHQRILDQVHYRGGLTPEKLIPDLESQGFCEIRQHSTRGIYWWGMRKAPIADRLRLLAPRRFAISARKPE